MTLMTKIFAATTALTLTGTAAVAQTNWDLTTAWGANNFHAQSAIAFADAVRDATDGTVDITVHLSGETGVKIGRSREWHRSDGRYVAFPPSGRRTLFGCRHLALPDPRAG